MNVTELRNGRVRCVGYKRIEQAFTLGKVYRVVDDHITRDDGYEYTLEHIWNYYPYRTTTIEYLSDWYEFEIVEDHKMEITTNGNELILTHTRDNGKTETIVMPYSGLGTRDFVKGVRAALDRLERKPQDRAKELVKKREENNKLNESGERSESNAEDCFSIDFDELINGLIGPYDELIGHIHQTAVDEQYTAGIWDDDLFF